MKIPTTEEIVAMCNLVRVADTLKERDAFLENLWHQMDGVPFDEDEDGALVLTEKWMDFEPGTNREDIWHWFDERHSKGVSYLLYGVPANSDKESEEMKAINDKCFECMAERCAFNPRGICKFPMVYGVAPEITEEDGCLDMLLARDAFEE